MVFHLLLGAVGVLLLAFAPDRFVAGSAGLADRWGMPRVMVGVVIVGFGTSAPEMLVSGLAAGQGDAEVGVGNIIGSNVANFSLILGVAALLGTMTVPHGIVRGELPLLAVATVWFAVAVQGGVSRLEGALLGAGMVVALLWMIRRSRQPVRPDEEELDAEIGEYLDEEEKGGTRKLVLDAVGGLAGTVLGAQLLVTGAVGLADEFGISGGFIGMTVVAFGTSLPELVTAVAAARAGEDKLVLGNLVGSNLFNCLGVGAIVGLAGGGSLDDASLTVGGVGLMLAITVAAMVAMATGRIVSRGEAVGLVVIYALAMPLLAG
jgi:cation:H+ antiporter